MEGSRTLIGSPKWVQTVTWTVVPVNFFIELYNSTLTWYVPTYEEEEGREREEEEEQEEEQAEEEEEEEERRRKRRKRRKRRRKK